MQKCDTCRFWIPLCVDSDSGECARYPLRAQCLKEHWCGEWKPAEKKPRPPNFTPPTVGEVRSYLAHRNSPISAEDFVNYYESRGWMIGQAKMKDWRAAVRTWESRQRQRDDGAVAKKRRLSGNSKLDKYLEK